MRLFVSIPVDKVRAVPLWHKKLMLSSRAFQSPWIRFAPESACAGPEDEDMSFQSPWIRFARDLYFDEFVKK